MKAKINQIISLFCEEPYRLFFPLGILIGIIGIGHWLIYALGWVDTYSGFFHASIQMQGYMACFVIGFLLTAMPRFSGTARSSRAELFTFLLLILSVVGFLFGGQWILAELSFIALLAALIRFAAVRVLGHSGGGEAKKVSPPVEFVWIPVAILHGVVGSVVLILNQLYVIPAWTIDIGQDMGQQGFILAVVAGVGGFLAPRLMGLYEAVKPSEVCTMEEAGRLRKRKVQIHLLAGTLFFLSFCFDIPGFETWAHGIRALVVTAVLIWTRSLPRPPRVPDFFAKLLWISMWMIPIGLWLIVFFPKYEKEMLHITFIGGLSLMTFAVATMVVLSHSGQAHRLRKPLFILWMVLIGVILTLGFRLAAALKGAWYFPLLGFAASLWIVVGVSWLCFVAPGILAVPAAGTFEHQHEQEKQRMNRLQH